MKKVIFSISAMLFVGAASFAQGNTSDVNQVGNSDISTVSQHGHLNTSDVDQIGNSNTSQVFQGVQPGLFDALRNKAVVMQSGDSTMLSFLKVT